MKAEAGKSAEKDAQGNNFIESPNNNYNVAASLPQFNLQNMSQHKNINYEDHGARHHY
jgi:hypothetical protein